MKRLLFILFAFSPLLLLAQSVDYYLNLGNSAYDQCNYEQALYYYERAGEIQRTTKVNSKINLVRTCLNWDRQARYAQQNGTEQEERKYLSELYKLHKSPLIKERLNSIHQRRLQRQAEQEAEERARQQEEAELQRQAEEDAWNWAVNENSISDYEDFISQYPSSEHVSEARTRMTELREQQMWSEACRTNTVAAYKTYLSNGGQKTDQAYFRIDECYWSQAKNTNTIDAYREYINRSTSPKNHVDEAARRVADIEDANNWDRACKTHTVNAYQNYINNGGKRSDEARKKIDEIYWGNAERSNTVAAYRQYVDRTTEGQKAYADEARKRIDVLTRQEDLISAAENAKDPLVAYGMAQAARKLGKLRSNDLQRVLQVEEPYMYAQAKSRKATLSQQKEYIRVYSSVAQYKNLEKVQKKINRKERQQERQQERQLREITRRNERESRALELKTTTSAKVYSDSGTSTTHTRSASREVPAEVVYSKSYVDISTHHVEGMFGLGIDLKQNNSLDYFVGGQYSYMHRIGGFYVNYLYGIESGNSLFQAGPAFRLTQNDEAKVDVSLSFGPSFLTDFHSCYYGGNIGLRFAQRKDGFCWWGGQIGCSYLSNGQIIPSVSLSFGITLGAGVVAGCVAGGVIAASKR